MKNSRVLIIGLLLSTVGIVDSLAQSDVARWTNSLGMVFVPIQKTSVRFSIWETRKADYAVFVREGHWGRCWPQSPTFTQTTKDPVVNTSWEDAKDFCIWLTQKEQQEGRISKHQVYRLPTDAEWSLALGLNKETGATAEKKSVSVIGAGGAPGKGATLMTPSASGSAKVGGANCTGKSDGFEFTSPVGSFAPSEYGLFDMQGNVWDWCMDFADDGQRNILRGGSWSNPKMALTVRDFTLPDNLIGNVGFRCVLTDDVGRR